MLSPSVTEEQEVAPGKFSSIWPRCQPWYLRKPAAGRDDRSSGTTPAPGSWKHASLPPVRQARAMDGKAIKAACPGPGQPGLPQIVILSP